MYSQGNVYISKLGMPCQALTLFATGMYQGRNFFNCEEYILAGSVGLLLGT